MKTAPIELARAAYTKRPRSSRCRFRFFFEDMPSEITGPEKFPAYAVVIDDQSTKLIRAYVSVQNDRVRKSIRALVRELAKGSEHEGI